MNATISNSTFSSTVNWDGKDLESVHTVAKALLNLTELFKAQGVECLVNFVSTEEKKNPINHIMAKRKTRK